MPLSQLKIQMRSFADRIDAMSIRERGLIFITVMVVLYVFAFNVLFGPIHLEKDRLQKLVDQKHEETKLLELQIQGMLGTGSQDPDAAKREKLAAIEQSTKTIDTALSQVTSGLVPPKEMARMVEQMLIKNRGLHVIKVESLPATPLLEGGQVTPGSPAAPGSMVYKHGMRIELKGSYLDILRYLKSLETMPWKVFWGQVTLDAENHPISKLNLLIYTLSTHEGWIGL